MPMLRSERGHITSGLSSLLAIAGTALLAIGLGRDATSLAVAGAIVLGLGSLLGVNASHLWLRPIYRRLDHVDPDDKDARPNTRVRIQF
jgi:hypothetical protein